MDKYSFISENGTIREIADIQARDTNTLQNTRLDELEAKRSRYSTEEALTDKIWIDGKPIYRRVLVTTMPFQITTNWTNVTYYCGSPTLNIETLVQAEKVNDKGYFFTLADANRILVARATSYDNVGVGTAFIIEYTKL